MEISIKTTGLDETIASLNKLVNIDEPLSKVMKNTAEDITTVAKMAIKESIDPSGVFYAPLAESTIERKKVKYPGKTWTILVDEGQMRRSLFGRAIRRGMEFGAAVPYLIYHQQGTKKMPRRAVFPLTEDMNLEPHGKGGKMWSRFIERVKGLV